LFIISCSFFFFFFFFFFFQAEDGIRDRTVTGVQTCALPISRSPSDDPRYHQSASSEGERGPATNRRGAGADPGAGGSLSRLSRRSEERRVGKEGRAGGGGYKEKEKKKKKGIAAVMKRGEIQE